MRHHYSVRLFVGLCAAALLLSVSTTALSEDSCTCSKQTDGSTFCTCVDDNGHTYCKSCPANGGDCTVVPCT